MGKMKDVQGELRREGISGWLLYDFRRSNALACRFLEIPEGQLLTRRFFYWIPAVGECVKIVQRIESHVLDHLPGRAVAYQTWQELEEALGACLRGAKKVAMEYSPRNAIPSVSKVDAGTVDLVRSFGVEVVSSANILQQYTNVWNGQKFKWHLQAARVLDTLAAEVWKKIERAFKNREIITEFHVQQFMLQRMEEQGCVTADAPICAVNAHSADPHFSPEEAGSSPIQPGDFVLIDLWCKVDHPDAPYADITRVASSRPTEKQRAVFETVKLAQHEATQFVRDRFAAQKLTQGWEVDQVCRDVIDRAGYGAYFVHRTGHNIDTTDHGPGTHIDNFETHDDRLLLPSTCFSIEPGIYLPGEFGVRLEYDVYIHPEGRIEVTGGQQTQIHSLAEA